MNNKAYYKQGGMSKRRIEEHLSKKIGEWLDSIKDEHLKGLIRRDLVLTGGAIASLLLGEKVKDYDVYFKTRETALAVRRYYKKLLPEPVKVEDMVAHEIEDALEQEDLPPYSSVYMTKNALSLSGDIQIITRFHGKPEEIHKSYDFVHATNWWDITSGELTLLPEAMESLLCKQLRYQGSLYPVCSILRIRKFLNRGWSINAGQVLKILLQVSALDLKDINVLREQLIGIDSEYFMELLKQLEEAAKGGLDETIIVRLVDKVFG